MVVGALRDDELDVAAAVRAAGVTLPMSADAVGVGLASVWVIIGEASGVAIEMGAMDLSVRDSFTCFEVFSWGGATGGVVGVSSAEGSWVADMLFSRGGRRINLWGFLVGEMAVFVLVELVPLAFVPAI